MTPDDLKYEQLSTMVGPDMDKGRTESISFLNWFLENIFRLDPIEADDSICDKPNDRGIDGIYVDHTQEEVLVLQSKIKQKEASLGDAPLRELAGTLTQLETEASVQALLDGGGHPELKKSLERSQVKTLVGKGYRVVGAFVSNQPLDANGKEFMDQCKNIRVYDRNRIAAEYIDIESEGGIDDEFFFDAGYVEPMVLKTGDKVVTYILPVKASELVSMKGIDDGTLFSQNVRQSLGNTKVNKSLGDSVKSKDEHKNFPLYHNGVTILCGEAEHSKDKLRIRGYVVVNGAQSISTFKKSASHLSDDLRVIAKVVKLDDTNLARKITINCNNQNAIKPRDLKSTNEIQLRLREEIKKIDGGKYDLEIKRGQDVVEGVKVIRNEEAGRLLLAFDLMEPESCHQVYKLFDEKYADIFARPAVTAWRIVLLDQIMQRIVNAAEKIEYKPLAKYGLTRFFLLSVVAEVISRDDKAKAYMQNPKSLFDEGKVVSFSTAIDDLLATLVVDLNFEVKEAGETFDYKGDLKSQTKIRDLRAALLRSYEKDVQRKKASALADLIA